MLGGTRKCKPLKCVWKGLGRFWPFHQHNISTTERFFCALVDEQATNKAMYKKWEQRCINELEEYKNKQKKLGQTLLNNFYTHKLNRIRLSNSIENSRVEAEKVARKTAASLIFARENETGTENVVFTDDEINAEFKKFWEKSSRGV